MKKLIAILLTLTLILTACKRETENIDDIPDMQSQFTIDDLNRIRDIVWEPLSEEYPLTGGYVDEAEKKVVIEFMRSDEEMTELRENIYSFLGKIIKENQELSDLGADESCFNLLGTGPAIMIPADDWESNFHQSEKLRHLPNIDVSNISPTGLTFRFINSTDDEFMYGSHYQLFVREGDVWRLLNAGMMFTDEGYTIMPQSQTEEASINWEWVFGELSAGEYGFQKSIMFWRAPGDFDEYNVRYEFTIM